MLKDRFEKKERKEIARKFWESEIKLIKRRKKSFSIPHILQQKKNEKKKKTFT